MDSLPRVWKDHLRSPLLPKEKDLGRYQPLEIFRAFRLTPPEDVRVVLLGMDPYPTPGVPEGLAFSCSGTKAPASLRNILKEWQSDLGRGKPLSGSLEPWGREGVLLLNAALTVHPGAPGSHLHLWRDFSRSVVRTLPEAVFLLFGKDASRLAGDMPYTVQVPHPSPLSAWRGFFGSRPFSQTNSLLVSLGKKPLSWDLPAG